MSPSSEANIAASFNFIHNIITRGLKVSVQGIQGARQPGFQEQGSREGLFNYIRALSSVVNSHHLTEDELAFPYFRLLLPTAPFDFLMNGHREMVKLLTEINEILARCEKNDQEAADAANLESALVRLNEFWPPHIQVEWEEFISKADALVPVAEQLRLTQQFQEHGVKHAVPPYLTVPFLLYNLPLDERKEFSQGMPAELLQNLVPIVWKEKWEAMQPFLLS